MIAHINQPGDALIGATGVVPARVAESHIIDGALPIVEIATIVLIMLIVGMTFRAVGAPLITLLAAIIAYVLTIHVLGYVAARLNMTIPVDLEPLLVVLILAVCTDYASSSSPAPSASCWPGSRAPPREPPPPSSRRSSIPPG